MKECEELVRILSRNGIEQAQTEDVVNEIAVDLKNL